jgi:Ca2+-binding EF-hand superfamily protein
MGHSSERIDHARLRADPEYLAAMACEQFKQNDRYHRGLLTAQAFSQALEALGLRFGQPEVEDIIQYCIITDDGYVHYKGLLTHCQPSEPRAKQSTAKTTIFPQEEDRATCSTSHTAVPSWMEPSTTTAAESRQRMYLTERTEDIRQAYARWDRGLYSNEAFKEELRGYGITLTKELERLLEVHSCSRNMSFGQLMSALQIDENDGRKARAQHRGSDTDSVLSASRDMRDTRGRQHDEQSVCSSVTAVTGDLHDNLRQAICDFVDGRIPAITFRRQLHHNGVPLSQELDRLIRT